MKMVHGLKMRASKLNSITFAIILFILAFIADAKTLKVDTLTPSVTDGNLLLQRNGTGEVTFGDYSGFCKFASGSPTCYANIDLTSHVTGILPIANGGTGTSSTTFVNAATNVTGVLPVANGGTNSSTALNNNFVMISSGGSIVEDANISTTELGYLNNVSSNLQTQLDAKVGDTGDESIAGLKTFTNLITASSAVTFGEIATPSTPSSGIKVYAKSDGKLYQLDSAGSEKKVGSGGGGEAGINFISDGSFEDSTLNPDSDGGGIESYQTYTTDADLYSESNLQYFRVAYTGLSAADTYVRDSFARTALSGKQGFFSIWIKANADDFKVCVRVDDATFAAACDSALEHTIIGDSTWRKYEIPFVFGSATVQYEIYNESYTGDVNIEIDKVYVGTVPDGYIQTVGQASFVGSSLYSVTNCTVTDTGTASAWNTLVDDNDCVAVNTGGIVGNLDMSIDILNARTDGYYKVQWSGLIEAGVTGSARVSLSSTSTYDNQGTAQATVIAGTIDSLEGNFRFSSGGTKTIQMVFYPTAGTTSVNVYGLPVGLNSQFTVHFFPDSEANIVTQSTELPVVRGEGNGGTSITANVTPIDFTEVEDKSGSWDGDEFTAPSSGEYSISGLVNFTAATTSTVAIYIDGSIDKVIGNDATSSSYKLFSGKTYLSKGEVLSIRVNNNVTLLSDTNLHHIHIQKLPTDATIIGKFENINSSELCQISAYGNDAEAITAGTEDIPFKTEITDNCGIFDNSGNTGSNTNDAITPTRSSRWVITGSFAGSTTASGFSLYKNGSTDIQRCGVNEGGVSTISFSCQAYLEAGQVYTFRTGTGHTLINTQTIHFLEATELPDTESIIKNLNDNNNFECQTKFLSSNSTTAGNVSDLQFTGLEVGKKYSYEALINGNSGAIAYVQNNTSYLFRYANSSANSVTMSDNCFTSEVTTLEFYQDNTVSINGNGSDLQTWAKLCKLPDNTICESTRF